MTYVTPQCNAKQQHRCKLVKNQLTTLSTRALNTCNKLASPKLDASCPISPAFEPTQQDQSKRSAGACWQSRVHLLPAVQGPTTPTGPFVLARHVGSRGKSNPEALPASLPADTPAVGLPP